MTEQPSISLGAKKHKELIKASGLLLVEEFEDEGENHYFNSTNSENDHHARSVPETIYPVTTTLEKGEYNKLFQGLLMFPLSSIGLVMYLNL
jgi:hypothetical protein